MKSRVTVSLARDVIAEAERLGATRGLRSRSAGVEGGVGVVVRQLRGEDTARALAAYSRGQTAEEIAEEAAMTQGFRRKRRSVDLDGPPRRAPGRKRAR